MGVKSYVAGLKADAENTLLDLGVGGLEAVSKLAGMLRGQNDTGIS